MHYVLALHIYLYLYAYMYAYAYLYVQVYAYCMCMCMHIQMIICICMHMRLCMHIHTCMHICMRMCVFMGWGLRREERVLLRGFWHRLRRGKKEVEAGCWSYPTGHSRADPPGCSTSCGNWLGFRWCRVNISTPAASCRGIDSRSESSPR